MSTFTERTPSEGAPRSKSVTFVQSVFLLQGELPLRVPHASITVVSPSLDVAAGAARLVVVALTRSLASLIRAGKTVLLEVVLCRPRPATGVFVSNLVAA